MPADPSTLVIGTAPGEWVTERDRLRFGFEAEGLAMADVGIRELKRRLSEYLDRAERGEVVRVTDRGRPKAIIGPVPGRARLEDGIRDGWITPGTCSPLLPVHRAKATRRVLDALAEDRSVTWTRPIRPTQMPC